LKGISEDINKMNYLTQNQRTKMEERITKQELMKLYKVDRLTIEVWRKRFGLPIIEISSHKKYVRKQDLIEWENNLIGSSCKIGS
jgi:hypothetical protein